MMPCLKKRGIPCLKYKSSVSPTSGIHLGGWMALIFQKVLRIGLFTERMSLCKSGSCSLLRDKSIFSEISIEA